MDIKLTDNDGKINSEVKKMNNNIHINPESIGKFRVISDEPSPEGYESPITGYIKQFSQQIIEQRDNEIVAQINEEIGIDVDKNELIRALNYDRDQFNEGYKKGYRDAQKKYEEALKDLISRSDALKAVDARHEELLHDTEYRRKNCQIDLLGIKKHILAIPPANILKPADDVLKEDIEDMEDDNIVNDIAYYLYEYKKSEDKE